MYDVILVGTDGSPEAEAAIDHAITLGAATGAVVHVVAVVDSSGSPMAFGIGEVDDINRAAEELVEDVRSVYRGEDVEIRGDVRRGEPAEALETYAADAGADLIVVGQRGAGGVTTSILGSTADRLARTATIPVTIVPVER